MLRFLLDSHSQIAALPETPWLLGAYGPDPSLRGVLQGLIGGPYGAVRNVSGVEADHILAAGRSFLETLFLPLLGKRNKRLLAFKTPADIRHLDFLVRLFPDAVYIHITRDGRDVALSQLAKKGSFFHDLKEYRRIGFANLLKRWADWEQRIRDVLYRDGLRVVHLKYEDLTADPQRELQRVTAFLGVPFEAEMLDYASMDHDYPIWEAGSTDVARNQGVSDASSGKWRETRMTAEMRYALATYDPVLTELGYSPSGVSPNSSTRAFAALYPLIDTVLDVASRTWSSWLAPLCKDASRIIATSALLLLAAHFLTPGRWIRALDLTHDAYQLLRCFAAALSFAIAFGPAFRRRSTGQSPLRETFFKLSAAMLLAAGTVPEWGQNFVADRHGFRRFPLERRGGCVRDAAVDSAVE